MKRATYLCYRDPRERTPASALPTVTNDGVQLFNSNDWHMKNQSRRKFSKSRRFQEHFEIVKWRACEPGPLDYKP